MSIIWAVIEFLASVFELCVVINFLGRVMEPKFSDGKGVLTNVAAVFILTVYISTVNEFLTFEGLISLIAIMITVIYAFIALRGPVVMKIIAPILAYTEMLLIDITVTFLLSFIFGMPDSFIFFENDGTRLAALFLTKILFFCAMNITAKFFRKEKIILRSRETAVTVSVSLVTFTVSVLLVMLQIETDYDGKLIFISILGMILIDLFIIYMMKQLADDNENRLRIAMLETQIREEKAMIEDVGTMNLEIKRVEHDLRHHLFTVLGMVEGGENASAEAYLKEMLHECESSIFKYITIDNNAVGSILNIKIGRCHAENIDIKVQIESDFRGFDDLDLCVLLSNLLDNAIEASRSASVPLISLSIENEKGYLCVTVKNRIDTSVLDGNRELKTTKQDKEKHGLGIYSVREIVKKYDGFENFREENGFFVAEVWLRH
ncbi:MAG: GHKL domain-containing protein [Clostridia bacterium]|nr:GHKL domain-containing protein [Clostridia bacterium]